MSRRTAVLIIAVALAGWAPAAAQTPPPAPAAAVGLAVTRPHTGWVSLRVSGPPGAVAAVTENGGAGPAPVATVTIGPAGAATVDRAAPWRCDRRTRSFTVTVTAADGTSQSAAGCRAHADMRGATGRRAAADAAAGAAARDGAGQRPLAAGRGRCDACARRSPAACVAVPQRATGRRPGPGRLPLSPGPAGRYPVTVQGPAGRPTHRVLIVRPSTRRLRVLATGDSMIQIIDGDLQRRSGGRGPISVRSDAHISTGISKPFMFNWIAHARGAPARFIPT